MFGVLMSGCLRLSTEEDSDGARSATTAEKPTPTATATARSTTASETPTRTQSGGSSATERADYPPGMDEFGITDLLAEAHVDGLRGSSYRLEFRQENSSRDAVWERSTVEAADTRALETHAESPQFDVFYDDSERWWRAYHDGSTEYGTNDLGMNRNRLTKKSVLAALFRAGEYGSPEATGGSNEARFEVSATSIGAEQPLRSLLRSQRIDSIEDFGVELTVDPDGIVRHLQAEIQAVWADRLNTVHIELRTDDLGTTTVESPAWLSTARDQAPRITVELSSDQRFVRYSNTAGGPVPQGSRAILHRIGTYSERDRKLLSAEIQPGESRYLWREDGETRLASDRPAEAEPIELGADFITSLDVGVANYARIRIDELQ